MPAPVSVYNTNLQTVLSSKILLRLILCILVIALVMTRSRMGNIAFFTSMLLCGAVHLYLCKKFTCSAVVLFASLLVIDTLIISQWFGLSELAQRLNLTVQNIEIQSASGANRNAATDHDQSIQKAQQYQLITGDDRDKTWRQARAMRQEHYLLGTGYGSFYTLFPQYRDGSNLGFYDYAHNDYLQFIIEFGLPGTLCFIVLITLALTNAVQAQRLGRGKMAISAAFATMMGIFSLAMHSWTDFNLYIPANAMLICILLATSVPARWMRKEHRRRQRT